MKLQRCLQLMMVAMGMLVAGHAAAASAEKIDSDKIKALDDVCPRCVKVARDVLALRVEHCKVQNAYFEMMVGTMRSDPMYGFMLAVDSMVAPAAYKTVMTAAATHVDCDNPNNWINMTQQALKKETPKTSLS
ncbi:TPA: hypothetical protein P2Q19_002352 [Aeromonas salmonicida]|nr:hypothetical protein [Aeromonas salmonicida]